MDLSTFSDFLFAALLVFIAVIFAIPLIRGAPFVPTDDAAALAMIKLAQIRPGEKVADLGSGDGRLLIAAARAGAEATGYEIHPMLVWYSRYKVRRSGLGKDISIHFKDFWNVDLSQFNVVMLFGITKIMPRLEEKLKRELKPGARVVSYAFKFPSWPPELKENGVYLYKKT